MLLLQDVQNLLRNTKNDINKRKSIAQVVGIKTNLKVNKEVCGIEIWALSFLTNRNWKTKGRCPDYPIRFNAFL